MRRLLIGLLIFAGLSGVAYAVDQQFVYKNATLGTTSTLVTFGFPAKTAIIQNRNAAGGVGVYIDFVGGTADSSDFELVAGATISVSSAQLRGGFGRLAIRSASGTSDVQILAVN